MSTLQGLESAGAPRRCVEPPTFIDSPFSTKAEYTAFLSLDGPAQAVALQAARNKTILQTMRHSDATHAISPAFGRKAAIRRNGASLNDLNAFMGDATHAISPAFGRTAAIRRNGVSLNDLNAFMAELGEKVVREPATVQPWLREAAARHHHRRSARGSVSAPVTPAALRHSFLVTAMPGDLLHVDGAPDALSARPSAASQRKSPMPAIPGTPQQSIDVERWSDLESILDREQMEHCANAANTAAPAVAATRADAARAAATCIAAA